MRLYRGLYSTLGSYELLQLKWDFDITSYYNLWVDPYMQDQHLDAGLLDRQLREQPYVLQTLSNFADLFRKVEATLRARGQFFRANLGELSEPLATVEYTRQVGTPRSRDEILARTKDAFNAIRRRALELLEDTATPRTPLPLASFMMSRPIV